MNEYYTVLGLPSTASFDDVKKQYNKLVKQYHPDINPTGHDKFQQIQEAYNKINNTPKSPSSSEHTSSLDIDLDKIFNSDVYRFNKKKTKYSKPVTIEIVASVKEYSNGNFYRMIVLDNGQQYHYTFPKGIVPYKTKKTDTVEINGVKYTINFSFTLDDETIKYEYDTDRFIKHVKLSAHEFHTTTKIPIEWNSDIYDLNITSVSTDQLLKLKGKGFYNSTRKTNEDLYIKIIVYKG